LFTVPTELLYQAVESGRIGRRCCLISPYREHFSARLAGYLGRIGLPKEHNL
jgi:hypothetical protein